MEIQQHSNIENTDNQKSLFKKYAIIAAYITVFYNVTEGLVSIILGEESGQISLVFFGIQSFVEVTSGIIVLWRVVAIDVQEKTISSIQLRREKITTVLIGFLLILLSISTFGTSIVDLIEEKEPESTIPGIVVTICSFVLMIFLWSSKVKIAKVLNSSTIQGDAKCSLACMQMTVILLIGSIIYNFEKSIWWLDSAMAIVLGIFFGKDGYQTIKWGLSSQFNGGCCGECAQYNQKLPCKDKCCAKSTQKQCYKEEQEICLCCQQDKCNNEAADDSCCQENNQNKIEDKCCSQNKQQQCEQLNNQQQIQEQDDSCCQENKKQCKKDEICCGEKQNICKNDDDCCQQQHDKVKQDSCCSNENQPHQQQINCKDMKNNQIIQESCCQQKNNKEINQRSCCVDKNNNLKECCKQKSNCCKQKCEKIDNINNQFQQNCCSSRNQKQQNEYKENINKQKDQIDSCNSCCQKKQEQISHNYQDDPIDDNQKQDIQIRNMNMHYNNINILVN